MFTVASALCGAAPSVDAAGRRPRGAGARCGAAGAGVARPRRRGVPRGAARRTPSACGARPRPSRPASVPRSAAPSSSSAAGAGPSSSTCRSAWWPAGSARRQLVESRAPGRRRMPDLRGAALLAAAWARSTSASSRAATGGGPAPPCSVSFVAAAALPVAVRAQLARAPLAAARPGAAADPVRSASPRSPRCWRGSASTPTC